jgi:phenylacetate-CoA ligase
VSLYYEDMRTFLHQSDLGFHINAFQLVTRHFDTRDALILRIASTQFDSARDRFEAKIVELFHLARPMFAQAVEQNVIHPLAIEWATPSDIEINARTGKLRRVIDQRR